MWIRRIKVLPTLMAVVLIGGSGAVLAQTGESWELSRSDALKIALENNLDLVSARKDPAIAAEQIGARQSIFDPVFSADLTTSDSSSDSDITSTRTLGGTLLGTITTDGTTDSESLTGNLNWNHLLSFGASYDLRLNLFDLDFESTSIQPATGDLQSSVFEQEPKTLTLTYTMPLLKGFGTEVNRVDVLLAQSNLDTSREDLRLQAIQTIKQTEDAYWDVLARRAALDVARESLKLAQDLYELNKKKVEVGTLPPIDITQAEAGVAGREEDVIVAEVALENAEDVLRGLLAFPPDDPRWSMPITPTDRADFQAREVAVESALATALAKRSEIINARQQLKDSELSERVARRSKKHQLDLVATFAPNEDEQVRTIATPQLGTLVVDDSVTESDGEDWSLRLNYALPLRNRQAKVDYAVARLNREKSEVALRKAEQDIRIDVRTAARNVNSGAKRVAAARSNTVLQRKTLEAEQKKYENGMSTSFEVLRIQTDLSDARLAEIRAILDYMKGLSDLERAKGTLLEARNLALGR
jgi:outer membrane protein TolC